jgi:hypothetical protein
MRRIDCVGVAELRILTYESGKLLEGVEDHQKFLPRSHSAYIIDPDHGFIAHIEFVSF